MPYKNIGTKVKSWIEVSRNDLSHNLDEFRRIALSGVRICSVVKANAYGHGLKEVSIELEKFGVDWFAVDSIDEALSLRDFGIKKPVLILGYVCPGRLEDAINRDVSITVYNLETLEKIVKLGMTQKAKIHLKIETGLNRQGIEEKNIPRFIKFIRRYEERFITEGISMHFADIEDAKDQDFARLQLQRFNKIVMDVEKLGIKFTIRHAAASASAILYPETHLDMIRVGIGMYGLHPSKRTVSEVVLWPIMTWKAVLAQIKNVTKGETVSYGRTWVAKRETRIAVVPIGYSDGFDRKLSNYGRVIIRKKYAPVIGRVCMNMFMVDVTEIPDVRLDDEVIVIGKSDNLEITADDIAWQIGTMNYEVVSRINPLLPRIFI